MPNLLGNLVAAFRESFSTKGRGDQSGGYRANIFTGGGRTQTMARNAKGYAAEGYGLCVVSYRCVDVLAKAVASIKLKVVSGEDDQEVDKNHPLVQLLKQPNPLQSWRTFCEEFVAFRLIAGNSYIDAVGPSENQPPLEMWIYPPYYFKVVEPKNGYIPGGWVYDDGMIGHRKTWAVDVATGQSDLLQWKTFNPLNQWFGQSPLEAAAYAVDQHNSASAWNKNLLENNALPSGALATPNELTPAQFAQLKTEIATSYQGAQNARRPMLLESGLTWQQFSMSPADLDWLQGKLSSAQDVAAAFGVPLQVIPLPGSQTFANYAEARLALYEDTAIPLHENMCDALNAWLVPMFGDNLRIVGDYESLPALGARRDAKWAAVGTANWMTLNEKREATGFEVVDDPGADVLYAPSGQLPIGFDPGESEMEEVVEAAPVKEEPIEEAPVLDKAMLSTVQSVLLSVTNKELPADAALIMLQQAFPAMDPDEVEAMVNSAAAFQPVVPVEDAAAAVDEAKQIVSEKMQNMQLDHIIDNLKAKTPVAWEIEYDDAGQMIGFSPK